MLEEITLEDLVNCSGLSLRTVRFYIQEGLLQGPVTRGKYAHYSPYHLDQLKLIQRLKRIRVPLGEIRQLLENMTPEEIQELCRQQEILNPSWIEFNDDPSPSGDEVDSNALDYITKLERSWEIIPVVVQQNFGNPIPKQITSNDILEPASNYVGVESLVEKEMWHRFEISDGVELHIRSDKNISRSQLDSLINELSKHTNK